MTEPAGSRGFSAEQLRIIELPVTARTLVTAAAGTGKTHVLAGRLAHLVESDGLSAGDDVLVLSFSRAAVGELRRRVTGLAGDARYVGASTFDAFATRLLAATVPDFLVSYPDYVTRVREAVKLLDEGTQIDEITLVRHVLVDEIQDLVGPRADLIRALLRRIDSGFTLFGDPAQAIYGHQLQPGGSDTTNAELYQWIRSQFAGALISMDLTYNHRTETEQTKRVAAIGAHLREPEPDHDKIAYELRTHFLTLPTVSLPGARRMLLRENAGSSALLTRTNGEALRYSQGLFDVGIAHRYQRRGDDKAAPAWLTALFAGIDEPTTTRRGLADRLERVAETLSISPEVLFRLVRMLDRGQGRDVDLRRVADSVRDQDLPEELNQITPSSVVVSTIHRSKGLEFDRVLLGDPGRPRNGDPGEENRIQYVGLSRARTEIFHLDRPDTKGLAVDAATRRWVRRGFGPDQWKVYEFEVTGTDTHSLHPAGGWLMEADVSETQHYLETSVQPGDPLVLELTHRSADGEPTAYFTVYHSQRPVGMTSEEFAKALRLVLRHCGQPMWPRRIRAVHVDLVDTVAGHASVGRKYGLGANGLWLRVRMFGLGILEFTARAGPEGD
jgi:hypothetical protein